MKELEEMEKINVKLSAALEEVTLEQIKKSEVSSDLRLQIYCLHKKNINEFYSLPNFADAFLTLCCKTVNADCEAPFRSSQDSETSFC